MANIVLLEYAATQAGLSATNPVLNLEQVVFVKSITNAVNEPRKKGDGALAYNALPFIDNVKIETDSDYDLTQSFLAVNGNEVEITNVGSSSIELTTEDEPETLDAGETGKYRRISGQWVATGASSGGAGIPNYLDSKASAWTEETGWTLSEETTTPIDLEGTIKAVVADGTTIGNGFEQDIIVSKIDRNSKVQLSFNFANDANTDFSLLTLKVLDADDSDAILFEADLNDDTFVVENSLESTYRFSTVFQSTGSTNYTIRIETNSAISTGSGMSMFFSTFFCGAPFYFTAPKTGLKAGQYYWAAYSELDTDELFASGPEVSQTEYSDLYEAVGDMWEAERVNAGWPASSAGYFYPGPSAGSYFRSALAPITFTDSDIDISTDAIDLSGSLDISVTDEFRDSTKVILKLVSGTIPGGLSDGGEYYIRGFGSGTFKLFTQESDAIANSSKIDITSTGSGTFQLIQVGGYLDDAFQGHWHEERPNTGPGSSSRLAYRGDANTAVGTTDKQTIRDAITDTVNGTPRTSNETRPQTTYLNLIVRAKNQQSVELMAKQTQRRDFSNIIYDATEPDANNLGPDEMIALNGSTFNFSDFSEINANKLTLTSVGLITDNGDGTFTTKAITPALGWRTVWENTGSNPSSVTNSWGLGQYLIIAHYAVGNASTFSALINVVSLTAFAYSAEYMGATTSDQIGVVQNSSGAFVYNGAGGFSGGYIEKIQKLEETAYAYLKTKSLSTILLAENLNQPGYNGTVYRPAVKDISSADATTDLSQYWSTGSSPKLDGWRIKAGWAGGDGEVTGGAHKFTVPAGVKLENDFVQLAPGDNSTTFAWCGYGTGALELEKDEANDRWIVVTDGCWDLIDIADSGYQTERQIRRYTNKLVECSGVWQDTGYSINNSYGGIYRSDPDEIIFGYTMKKIKDYETGNGNSNAYAWHTTRGWTVTGANNLTFLDGTGRTSIALAMSWKATGEDRD